MNNPLERILSLIKSNYGTDAAFEDALKIKRKTVDSWKRGNSKSYMKLLLNISSLFGVSTDYLLTGEEKVIPIGKRKGVKIPVLGYVRAGIPVEAVEEILDYEEIPQEWAAQGDYFALRVRGDSMQPRMYEGDVVIVQKQSDVESGDLAIVLVNGEDATVKKVMKNPQGITLVPFNPTYQPMVYSCKDILQLPVTIMGKVVELRAKF